jgi:hypothetical protein
MIGSQALHCVQRAPYSNCEERQRHAKSKKDPMPAKEIRVDAIPEGMCVRCGIVGSHRNRAPRISGRKATPAEGPAGARTASDSASSRYQLLPGAGPRRPAPMIGGITVGTLALILMRVLFVEASLTHARAKRNLLVFRTAFGLRLLLGIGVGIFLIQIVKGYGDESGWMVGMLAALVVLTLFGWPSTLTVDAVAIAQRRWYRRPKRIPWDEVTAILRNKAGAMQVLSKTGATITFTQYQVDAARFQSEVLRRANIDTVLDPSSPPSLRV